MNQIAKRGSRGASLGALAAVAVLAAAMPAPASAIPAAGVLEGGTTLVTFDTETPGTFTT